MAINTHINSTLSAPHHRSGDVRDSVAVVGVGQAQDLTISWDSARVSLRGDVLAACASAALNLMSDGLVSL